MLRTAGLLAPPRRALSAGFDGGISPPFQFVAAQLLGGWDLTETGLAPASPLELIWTHLKRGTPASYCGCCVSAIPGASSLHFALSRQREFFPFARFAPSRQSFDFHF